MNKNDLRTQVLNDKGCSYWIKDAIRQLDDRDPVDAMKDARLLFDIFKQKCDRELGRLK